MSKSKLAAFDAEVLFNRAHSWVLAKASADSYYGRTGRENESFETNARDAEKNFKDTLNTLTKDKK